ncbi:Spc98 family-domain-containing protein [Mortierella sp. GBAus27b]|nr:Spc98 family-domain-containing protein [Mortierella sp. GBAus27b]
MSDLDPASLLRIRHDRHTRTYLSPKLFDCVGEGVSSSLCTIPQLESPLATSQEPSVNPLSSTRVLKPSFLGYERNNERTRMETLCDDTDRKCDASCGGCLHQRVRYLGAEPLDNADTSSSSYNINPLNQPPVNEKRKAEIFEIPTTIKGTVDNVLELPPLAKRPRDILEGSYQRDILVTVRNISRNSSSDFTQTKDPSSLDATSAVDKSPNTETDVWRATGTRSQAVLLYNDSEEPSKANGSGDKAILTWEMNTKSGPTVRSDMRSPYVTESGTLLFETFYRRYQDYAFKFQPTPVIIPYESLVDTVLLLLGGTSSSIFTYDNDSMMFDMNVEGFRIEGCSSGSIMNLLEDALKAGTHMCRLTHVAETCISQGMGLTSIAFGRSLSSYLTVLQGGIVAFREISRTRQIHILELYNKTRNMIAILERLAILCRCHATQELTERPVTGLGFYLPSGPKLLSMIYDEIHQTPMTSDPLWTSLLLSLLSQASTPYMEILSRWLGLSSSARETRDESKSSAVINQDVLPKFGLVDREIEKEGGDSHFKIFDCHLEQSLQGLDLFGEFFVRSKHEWSWDGSEPIMLADPLDYDGEFRMSRGIRPASFISAQLARKIMEAGRELQLLVEYDPRHTLIVQSKDQNLTRKGFEWLYVQEDIVACTDHCSKLTRLVLQDLAAKLERMGWLAGTRQERIQKQKGKQVERECSAASEAESEMDVDESVLGSHGYRQPRNSLEPKPQDFISLPATLGMARDTLPTCPDLMEFLLSPPISQRGSPSAFHSTVLTPDHDKACEDMVNNRSRLENIASLRALAEDGLCNAIQRRNSLIHTCVMSLYFHDLHLLDYLSAMERFMLMGDARFADGLSQALFEGDMGLVSRTVRAFRIWSDTEVIGGGAGRQSSAVSTWTRESQVLWPPRSGELEMTLRAVLLECIQSSSNDDVHADSIGVINSASNDLDMEVEEGVAQPSSASTRNMKRRKKLNISELEQSLAFAVQDYDDETKIPKDVTALDALDFLYLDFKPPRPLRLLFFTAEVMGKYTRLFTFQLRLARVAAALNVIFQQLRLRQKNVTSMRAGTSPERSQKPQGIHEMFEQEMAIMHRFRFEAQYTFEGLRGYVAEITIGTSWRILLQRLSAIQTQIEEQIVSGTVGPLHGWIADMGGQETAEEDGVSLAFEFEDLKTLHVYHSHVLDQMLERSFLTRKHAIIMKLISRILSSILKLSQFVDQLSDVALEAEQQQEQTEARIAKLRNMHEKFKSLRCDLIKVLKVVGAQSSDGLAQQLLVRLDVFP